MSVFLSNMPGLLNLGNTCFLNSVLQGLIRCEPLASYFKEPHVTRESKKAPLVPAFRAFLQDAATQSLVRPTGLVSALASVVRACDDDWWSPRQQADAAECLQYLLDGLHDAVYRQVRITIQGEAHTPEQASQIKALQAWSQFFAKEYSPIVEHFYGQSQSKVTCQKCKTTTERYEPWLMIKLPIPGGHTEGATVPTFASCMNAAFASETIEGYACDSCKSPQTAVINTRISKVPNILLLTFKRFTNAGAKIRGQIDWKLDGESLQPWLAFTRSPFSEKPATEFSTFAVIEHCGSARNGHYRMYARDAGTWMMYDDESVQKDAAVVSPDSYVIFAVPK